MQKNRDNQLTIASAIKGQPERDGKIVPTVAMVIA
jgi:hypothetical protein